MYQGLVVVLSLAGVVMGQAELQARLMAELGPKAGTELANLSLSELAGQAGMVTVYRETVRQAGLAAALRAGWPGRAGPPVKLLMAGEVWARAGARADLVTLKFPLEQLPSDTLVTAATLQLTMHGDGRVSVTQLVGAGLDGVVVGSLEVRGAEQQQLELVDTVQAWLMDPTARHGLLLSLPAGTAVTRASLAVEVERPRTRARRSGAPGAGGAECGAGAGRCCRERMTVNLRDLPGFDFILEPAEFEAWQCRGRCPARYRPRSDHALLQSLLHLTSPDTVKRPCCSPSRQAGLPVLHRDPADPAKLVVTQWRDVVVTECACG